MESAQSYAAGNPFNLSKRPNRFSKPLGIRKFSQRSDVKRIFVPFQKMLFLFENLHLRRVGTRRRVKKTWLYLLTSWLKWVIRHHPWSLHRLRALFRPRCSLNQTYGPCSTMLPVLDFWCLLHNSISISFVGTYVCATVNRIQINYYLVYFVVTWYIFYHLGITLHGRISV
jgi:hypothetical protein